MSTKQPDKLTIGAAGVLLSKQAIAVELGVSEDAAHKFIEELGLSWTEIGDKLYVGMAYLEAAIWWVTRPHALKRGILRQEDVPEALMGQWMAELGRVGYLYSGISKANLVSRLRRVLNPVRNVIDAEQPDRRRAETGRPTLSSDPDMSSLPAGHEP